MPCKRTHEEFLQRSSSIFIALLLGLFINYPKYRCKYSKKSTIIRIFTPRFNMFCDMIDQIIEFNIMSPLLGDGYKARKIETIKPHPLVPKDIVVRGFIIDSEIGELEEVK